MIFIFFRYKKLLVGMVSFASPDLAFINDICYTNDARF